MMSTSSSTFAVIFYIKKQKARNGKAPVYTRITVNGKRVEISTKRTIEIESWDSKAGMAKGNRQEARTLNRYLEQIKTKIYEHHQEMTLQGKFITAEAVKNKYLGMDQQEFTLMKLVEYHNTRMKDTLAPGTMKNYGTTKKYLERFLKSKLKTDDVYLTQINYPFVTDFEYFLRKWQPKDHQKPLNNNGIMKHMERFRKMINLAIRMEWMKNDPFAKFEPKFDRVERGFLSEEELETLEQKEFKLPRLRQVKDLFVFSCYTGLSYIDVVNLSPDNLTKGIDGGTWIVASRKKTFNPVRVPLLPKALEILEKYKDHPKVLNEGTLLPGISNQKLNAYLKEIADLCGIEKNLTFHLARHTFATTVTLSNGVPIESVSKMLGHTKISTTQIYAKVVETKLSQDMGALKSKLVNKGKSDLKTGTSQ